MGMALPNLRDAVGRLERACANIHDSPAARFGNGFAKPERCRRRQVSNRRVAASAFCRALHSGMALPNLCGAPDGLVAGRRWRQGRSTAAADVRLSRPGHVLSCLVDSGAADSMRQHSWFGGGADREWLCQTCSVLPTARLEQKSRRVGASLGAPLGNGLAKPVWIFRRPSGAASWAAAREHGGSV